MRGKAGAAVTVRRARCGAPFRTPRILERVGCRTACGACQRDVVGADGFEPPTYAL